MWSTWELSDRRSGAWVPALRGTHGHAGLGFPTLTLGSGYGGEFPPDTCQPWARGKPPPPTGASVSLSVQWGCPRVEPNAARAVQAHGGHLVCGRIHEPSDSTGDLCCITVTGCPSLRRVRKWLAWLAQGLSVSNLNAFNVGAPSPGHPEPSHSPRS